MKYHFNVYMEDNRYWADGIELPECQTQADSKKELVEQLLDVLNLYLDEPAGTNMVFPLPDYSLESKSEVLSISVDSKIAFSLLMRQYRISHRMSQKQAMESMGLRSRNSYARLEVKCNPSFETVNKVRQAFPDFPIFECFS